MHTEAWNTVPFGLVLRYEGGFCSRHFPLLADEKKPARHLVDRNSIPMINLLEVVTKPSCYASSPNGLPNVRRVLVWGTVEHIYPEFARGLGLGQRVFRAGFQCRNKLVSEGLIDIKDKFVTITHNSTSIAHERETGIELVEQKEIDADFATGCQPPFYGTQKKVVPLTHEH